MRHILRRAATTVALAGAMAAATAGTASASPSAPEIRYGMTGFKVYCVQIGISNHQESPNTWTAPDGEFGRNTLSTVKAFQGNLGLQVDGKVGKNTGGQVLWGIEHAKVKWGNWTTPWGVPIDNCYQVVPSHF
ncbi:peptidoglycan-binding protein [Streptomyces sp. NPDC020681]|uniref:peptidoglycan-binding protein n=1 Tax=Streptomyces sp. NPDC020681 TaxID=3365083 RepID=UPI0037A9CC9C